MAVSPASSSALATDTRSIDALRGSAARDPKAAIKEAAKQFEALFMQQLMKSMREATLSSGMLDNEGTKMGTEMLDTQFATKMTGLPGGLSEVIARQLERQMTAAPAAAAAPAGAANAPGGAADAKMSANQLGFVQEHTAAARAAEAQTGIPAAFMVAQAAHESGWGRREIRHADGASAHNLFGIKAGAGWNGPVAEVTTTEYVDGEARKVTAKFRAYGSYAESFQDYARLMKTSPRYGDVIANATTAQGFAQGLQRAGYATDPAYADKLTRVINTTLRMQRAVT
jgi:flagellar protein FlgJ